MRIRLFRISACLSLLLMSLGGVNPARAELGWRAYVDPSLGYSLMFPATLFDGAPVREHGGITVVSSRGARLYIFGGQNPGGRPPETVASQLSGDPHVGIVTYRRITPAWLVLSGYVAPQSDQPSRLIFYERIALSPDRSFLAGFRLVYPETQRAVFDPIIGSIGQSLRPPGSETTAAITASPRESAPESRDIHQTWCRQNYATYDPVTDSFLRFDGRRVPCVGPAD